MELDFELILLLASLLVVGVVFLLYSTSTGCTFCTSTSHPPPGPSAVPVLGNIHNLLFSSPLLHRSLHELSLKHGPFFQLKLGQMTLMVASIAEVAREVLKDHDLTFAQRSPLLLPSLIFYECSDLLFSPYGDYWRYLRKICHVELFSPKRVRSFASLRRQEVSHLVASVLRMSRSSSFQAQGVNLSRMIFEATCRMTCRAAFGNGSKFALEDVERLRELTNDITKMASGLGLADLFPSMAGMLKLKALSKITNFKLRKVIRAMDGILEQVLKEHKRKNYGKKNRGETEETESETEEAEPEDLVEVLLKLQQSPDLQFPLSDDNIKAVLLDMLVAGSHTTSATIGWIMSEMAKNPSSMQRAQAEVRSVFENTKLHDRNLEEEDAAIRQLQFLKCCIKEAMRLHPTVPLLARQSRTSCNVSTYDIPRNAIVTVNLWSVCRDPRYWADAERFVPERFIDCVDDADRFEFAPFGAGRRMCPGMGFAMANVEVAMARLLYHFDWEIAGQELEMGESFGFTVTRANDLFLIPTPNNPSFEK